jgi:hypothetical protein
MLSYQSAHLSAHKHEIMKMSTSITSTRWLWWCIIYAISNSSLFWKKFGSYVPVFEADQTTFN